LRLRIDVNRLFPFILFRSLAQLTVWLAILAGVAVLFSLFLHRQGELQAAMVGGFVGSLYAWIATLPYELRIEPTDTGECLLRVCYYLARSKMTPTFTANPAQIGVGEWAPLRKWPRYKGSNVEVLTDDKAVIVRGPRSMIKPLWRNFRGPWRAVLASTH
jgi:hypothetical protein